MATTLNFSAATIDELLAYVQNLGQEGYLFQGVATTVGTPVEAPSMAIYIADKAGTYTNYGNIVVNAGEVALLKLTDSTWTKEVLSLTSKEYAISLFNTINVDVLYPLTSGNYTINSAILVVDEIYKDRNRCITFLNAGGFSELWQLNGAISGWASASNWKKVLIGQATTSQIADNSITHIKMGASSVWGDVIQDGSISEVKLGAESVTTDKVKDRNITGAKIALNTIIQENIGGDLKLCAENFTTELKNKLTACTSYSSEQIDTAIGVVQAELDTLVGGNASTAIDSFREIEAFLATLTDSQTLTGILNDLRTTLETDYNTKISTLDSSAVHKTGDESIGGVKTFSRGGIFQKGAVFQGQDTLPTGIGDYVAMYMSPTYGLRIVAHNGTAYKPLKIGALVNGKFAIETNADGTTAFYGNISAPNVPFNATTQAPLTAGTYHTLESAIAAYPVALRSKGGKVIFCESEGIWQEYIYTTSDIAGWLTSSNWVSDSSTNVVANFNTIITNGIYSGINVVGAPDAREWEINHNNINATDSIQTATNVSDSNFMFRFKKNGIWGTWYSSSSSFFNKKNTDEITIEDSDGNIAIRITSAGTFIQNINIASAAISNFQNILTENIKFTEQSQIISTKNDLEILDNAGNIVAKIDSDGVTAVNSIVKKFTMPADVNMFISYGQSLSVQGGAPVYSNIITNNIIQFQNGLDIDLYNPVTNTYNGVATTPAEYFGTEFSARDISKNGRSLDAMMRVFDFAVAKENNYDINSLEFKLIGASCGLSGASIASLSNKSGAPYMRIIQSVEYAIRIAAADGKTFNVPVLAWIQGESDYSNTDTYYASMLSLFSEINTDIKAITGQYNDIQFIVYQPATQVGTQVGDGEHIIAQLMLDAAKNVSNIHLGSSMYQYSYYDVFHVADYCYHYVGAINGLAAKKIMDNTPFKPILPVSAKAITGIDGLCYVHLRLETNGLKLQFKSYSGLYNNNTLLASVLNSGFSIKNASSSEIITNVAISGEDQIILTCSESAVGLILTYAWTGKGGGGRLCDNYMEGNFYECIKMEPFFLNHFAPIFKVQL